MRSQSHHDRRNTTAKVFRHNIMRVSMTQSTFWSLIILLLILGTFFALFFSDNIKLFSFRDADRNDCLFFCI